MKKMTSLGCVPAPGGAGVADIEAGVAESSRLPNPFMSKKELKTSWVKKMMNLAKREWLEECQISDGTAWPKQ
jgi:hypothetical protein